MAQTATSSDNKRSLWLKITSNLYDYATHFGATGLNPPSWNDNAQDLEKKSVFISAKAVDIHP